MNPWEMEVVRGPVKLDHDIQVLLRTPDTSTLQVRVEVSATQR